MYAYLVRYHAAESFLERGRRNKDYHKTMLIVGWNMTHAAEQACLRLDEIAENCGAQIRFDSTIKKIELVEADYYFFDQAEEPEREDSPCPGA